MHTEIFIQEVDYSNAAHAKALLRLLDEYARDPMGGGKPLSARVMQTLPRELARLPHAFSVLAWAGNNAAGLVNCFEGFSTFAGKPLVNIHDVVVGKRYRGQGIAGDMLARVEQIARRRGCCKLTLEVLDGNQAARTAYQRFGFCAYELVPSMGQAEFWHKTLDAE